MHSSGMRTVRSSNHLSRGSLPQCMLGYQPPWSRPPRSRRPPPWSRHPQTRHPQSRHPPRADPPDQAPPQDLLQGMLGYHLQGMLGYHPPCGQTHTCKNITFVTSLRTVTRPALKLKLLPFER